MEVNTFLKNQQIKEVKKCLETKLNNTKPMGFNKNIAKREVHNNTSLPQETR